MSVKRVFGDPIESEGVTLVPVARVGGRGGGGGDNENNGGAGFGLSARPAGVYVIKNGEVTWKPAIDPGRILLAALAVLAGWKLARR